MKLAVIFGAKYLIYILIILMGLYFLKKDQRAKKEIAIFVGAVMPISYLIAKISSFFYYNPRPFVVGNFTPLFSHLADNGFPSDHTLLASALAATVFCFDKKMGIFFFMLAVIIGTSRVLAGVHHWMDIFGSILIALLVAYIASHFILKNKKIA